MPSEHKYEVKDVMNKVNDLIEKSNSLGKDYRTKHNELLSVFHAFEVMSEWIKKHNASTANDCAALIEDLMKLITEKSNLLKPEDEADLRRMKEKQKDIMNDFKNTGKGLSEVVTDLKDVLNKIEQSGGGNVNQSGGKKINQSGGSTSNKLTKKNKNNYKYK